jgi:type VI secretion system protein ImpA
MLDIEKLVQPVSQESPSGELLRYSAVYDAIRAARREDAADLPQGIWQTKLKKADWEEVRNICLDALEKRSKDLQIGAWLLEAAIHLDGFAGVVDGFQVLSALCENFWETLYPPLDPADPDYRFGPVSWIDEKLTLSLKLVPITKPKGGDETVFAWADWEAGLYQTRVAAKEKAVAKKPGSDPGQSLQSKFLASVGLTPEDFYLDLAGQLGAAGAEVERFGRLITKLEPREEGALHSMKDLLGSILRFVTETLAARGIDLNARPALDVGENSEPEVEPEMAVNEQREVSLSGPVRSRAQAYQMLAEAAEYLMKTEPHSPTPYLVRRAVAWGGMTLGELLQQILRNPGELGELYRLLGLDDGPPQKHKRGD